MGVRRAATIADLRAIQSIASARWPCGWHPGGLGWAIARWQLAPDPGSEIVVLAGGGGGRDGAVRAWATRGQHEMGEVSVQADLGSDPLIDELLDWALDGLDATPVSVEVYDGDHVLADALARRGFSPAAERPIVGMHRPTSVLTLMESGWNGAPESPPPRSDLGGYRVRATTDAEVDDRIGVHRRA